MSDDELLSVPQVARLVEVSERQVREAIHTGTLDAEKVGASYVVSRSDAESWGEELDDEEAAETEETESLEGGDDPDDPEDLDED